VDLERRVAAVAARITRRGFAVDTTQVMRARSACRNELAQTMPVLRGRRIDTLGATGRGAEQAVRALLAEGAPLTKRTPGGRYSVDREVLDGLSTAGYELAGLLRRARRADRYQRDYLDKMHANRGIDGRIRPTINTLGARTGRWTVGGALPLQQIPQAPGLRECLIADSGNVLVSFDYRGIEFVTLAAITRDSRMLAVFTSGSDPPCHGSVPTVSTSRLTGLPASSLTISGRLSPVTRSQHGCPGGLPPILAMSVMTTWGHWGACPSALSHT